MPIHTTCGYCSAAIVVKKRKRVSSYNYCSPEHYYAHRRIRFPPRRATALCTWCNEIIERESWRVGKSGICFCTFRCRAAYGNRAAKAAWSRPVGYTMTHATTGYVRIRTEDGWVAEHRQVMETQLGRALLPGENVHHVNGDKADNHPENLELWVTAQPSGQRPDDLLAFAYEMIERYQGQDGTTPRKSVV